MRSLKPVAVLAVVAAMLTVGAASALAAFQTGTYTGHTSQGRSVQFVVVPGKVKTFRWVDVAKCASRATFTQTGGFSNNIPIRRGTFHRGAIFSLTTVKPGVGLLHGTALVVVSGRSPRAGRATGTLGLQYVFKNSSGKQVDACSTGKIFWTAHK